MDNVKAKLGDQIEYGSNMYEVLNEADALLIATEWAVFRNPDFEKIKSLLKEKVIFDGRNLYDLDLMKRHGFRYESIGRALVK